MRRIFSIIILLFLIKSGFSQELSIQTGHSSIITDLAFSSDNRYLFSCGADNKVIIWDMAALKQMRLLIGHKTRVNALAVSPTDNILASCDDNGLILFWHYPDGKIVKEMKFNKPIKDIAFSPDGNNLACASDSIYIVDLQDNSVDVIDVKSRKTFTAVAYSQSGNYLAFGGRREFFVYIYETTYGRVVNKFRSQANSIEFSDDNKYIYSAGNNGSLKRRPVVKGNGKKQALLANNNWDSFTDVALSDKYVIATDRDNLVYVYDRNSGKRAAILKGHTKEPRCAAITSDGKYLATAGRDRQIILWNLDKFSVTKVLKSGSNSITSIAFSNDGDYMFLTYGDGVNKIWNLANKGQMLTNQPPSLNFFQKNSNKEYSSHNSFFTVNPDKDFVVNSIDKIGRITDKKDQSKQQIMVWDIKSYGDKYFLKNNKETVYRQFFIADTVGFVKVDFNATHLQQYSLWGHDKILDRQTVYSADVSVLVFQKPLKKKKFKIKDLYERTSFSIQGDVFFVNVSPQGDFLLALKNTENNGLVCDLWDLETGSKAGVLLLDKKYDDAGFSRSGNYFYLASASEQQIKIYDLSSLEVIDSVENAQTPFIFAENDEFCAYVDTARNLYLRNFRAKSPVFQINTLHQTEISDIKFNLPHKYIATSGFDGLIKFWDLSDGHNLVSLAAFNDDDFIYVSPDDYYYSTKGAMEYIGFVQNNRLYSFDQFDIKYNRPDTVLARLDYTSEDEIALYKKAYQKRVKKMGFNLAYLSGDNYNIPVVNIKNINELPISTEDNTITVRVSAKDSLYELDRINIWVNSVPVFGVNGFSVRELHEKDFEKEFDVSLGFGNNKIDVSVVNSKGIESLKQSFSIISEAKTTPDLYLITIGISDYKDDDLDLNYASKDARDVTDLFKKSKLFDNVIVYQYLNKDATRENILGIHDKLKNTKTDDEVIVFFAGHGMLDEDYSYYLPMYDFEYLKFFKTTLAYDEFIGIVDSIPARKKIVFIDACHSGEVDTDSDEPTGVVNVNETDRGVSDRSLWAAAGSPEFGSQSSFELMKAMFADLRRGSGTTIISSAGGQEFAFESSKIQNGVFTYVLLTGIKSKKADLNKDGKIMLSELQKYVMENVSRLTKGRQNPTNRRENLDYDFEVWK